ncbi:MAG: hypothetical protein PHF51_00005 [Candidatus ainarchaeum sp.]|nr:hypothetical protein [Candidatus ainarchaeum sp.]
MDPVFSSRYPFTSQAKEIVSSRKGGLTLDEVDAAKARVLAAASGGGLPAVRTRIASVLEREIFSYAGARVILACLQSRYLQGRYAVAESKRAGKHLHEDDDAVLARVAAELGMKVSVGTPYSMRFTEYLRFAPKDVKYKLSNKPLSGGTVTLDRNELVRVIEEAVRLRIDAGSPVDAALVPEPLRKAAEDVRKTLPKTGGFAARMDLKAEDYPPCVKELVSRLKDSENLPHTARWYLAAFLLQAGAKVDDVIALFRAAPDFDERTTRYQVEYIARKGYRVPSCSNAESYGICVAVCGTKSPIGFVKRRAFARGNAQAGGAAAKGGTGG